MNTPFDRCKGCNYEGRPMDRMPCLACTFGSRYEKAGTHHLDSSNIYMSVSTGCTSTNIHIVAKMLREVEERNNVRYEVMTIDKLKIKNVIFNEPATIVYWADGTKTVVKAQGDEPFDPEKGLAMAICKKSYGNEGSYFNVFKKWTKKYKPKSLYPDYTIPPIRLNIPESMRQQVREAAQNILESNGLIARKPGDK